MSNPNFEPTRSPQPSPSPRPMQRSASPQGSPETDGEPQSGKSSSQTGGIQKWVMGVAAAGLLAVGSFFYLHQTPSDDYTPQQVQQLQANFQHAYGHLQTVNVNDPQELQKAEDSLNLPDAQKQQLIDQAKTGQVKLGWVTLWDDMAEDGDVVQVSANGYSRIVPLWHKPITIAIPYTDNGVVELTGIKDGGGGGITVGIATSAGPVDVPPMTEGQVLDLPLH